MRSEIKSLTGLRGLAACWVMAGHYLGESSGLPVVRTVISHMYVAVDLFMILSGFVLAMTYEDRFKPGITAAVYVQFVHHRLARLFPLYALVTAVCLVMMRFGIGDNCSDQTLPGIVANFLMVQAWWWPDDSISGTGWSLSIEWGANLLFPMFVMAVLHASPRRAALVAAAAALCLVLLAVVQGQTTETDMVTGAINWYRVPNSLIRCITEFMIGMYCWRIRLHARWLGHSAALLPVLGGILVCTLVPALDVLFVLLCCCLVIGFSFQRSAVAAAFGSALPRWLGMISFSIYLWHLPLLPVRAVLVAWITGGPIGDQYQVPSAGQAIVCMILVLGLSTLSFYYIEKPMQRLLRRGIAAPLPAVPAPEML